MRRLGLRTRQEIESGEEAPRKRLRQAKDVDLAGPVTWKGDPMHLYKYIRHVGLVHLYTVYTGCRCRTSVYI